MLLSSERATEMKKNLFLVYTTVSGIMKQNGAPFKNIRRLKYASMTYPYAELPGNEMDTYAI